MPLISGIIPAQNFEVIRDAIMSILYAEMRNQEALTSTELVKSYYSERFVPPDETEFTLLNIQFAGGEYGNKDQRIVDGEYVYYICAYTSAKNTPAQDADKAATLKLHKVLGIVRAILMNPLYKTLGLTAGFIGNTLLSKIQIPKNDDFQDAANSIMGYVEFRVRASENVILIDPIPLAGSVTQVKLYLTDKGYRYGDDSGDLDFLEAEYSTDDNPVYLIAE